MLEAGLGRGHMVGGAVWAGPCGRAGHGPGLLAAAAEPPPPARVDPGPRTGTTRRTPAAPGPSLEERGAACRVRARAAGSHRGSQPEAGRGECRHGGGRETPAGTCRSLCLRRSAPVAPPPLPPSQARDPCRTLCPGKRGSFRPVPDPLHPSWERARDAGSRRGQTRVALAEPGRGTAASLGHTPGVLASEVASGPTSFHLSFLYSQSTSSSWERLWQRRGLGTGSRPPSCRRGLPFAGDRLNPESNFGSAGVPAEETSGSASIGTLQKPKAWREVGPSCPSTLRASQALIGLWH